jgi:FkbH-like protein
LDSFVFADDNPAESDFIRRSLPDVAVVYLGTDPALFIEQLDYGCWFDLQRYTSEDFGRANAYSSRLAAIADQPVKPTDIGTYLTSLEMVGRLYEPEENDVARIAQLEQKTNQFNLTTRRYSETAIRAFLDRDDVLVLAFSLADRFGNHGLVSAVIGVENGNSLTIDSWTMSCRIFSRSAEQFIMLGIMAAASKRGLRSIRGIYKPTPKNGIVSDLYSRLGFMAVPPGELWCRSLVDCDRKTDDLVTYIKRSDLEPFSARGVAE